jgi:integrase
MGQGINRLTDREIKNTTLDGKRQKKLADGDGLTLVVRPASSVWWLRYRLHGKERTLTLGHYPRLSLKEARAERDKARKLVDKGTDPVGHRRVEKTRQEQENQDTFRAIALEWYETVHKHSVGATTHPKNLRRMENHIFPYIGRTPMREITPPDVLEVLRRVEAKGHVDNAHRLKTIISQVFRYAVGTGKAERDITADLRGLIRSPRVKHHAAIVSPEELGDLLRAIWAYSGTPTVCGALKLAPMLFLRPGDLRQMRWDEIDWSEAQWSTEKTKNGEPLIVPLATQVLEILRELWGVNGRSQYIFPSARSRQRPMSENTVTAALINLGYKDIMTGHGFRATAKTLLHERLRFPVEIVEMQMAHQVRDVHGRAYNRTQWLDDRREMMQAWADYLDELKG